MPIQMTQEDAVLVTALEAAADRFSDMAMRHGGNAERAHNNARVCRDIAIRVRQYGRFASLRQRSYAEALVRWSRPQDLTPQQQAQAEVRQDAAASNSEQRRVFMTGLSLARISQLMQAAQRNGLRWPKIRLQRGEWKIRVYPAPSSSRNAGSYYVKASSGTRTGIYCGRIDPSGAFMPTDDCPLDVSMALREFNDNPLRVATAYGHATSHCCFCGRPLTDARSVAMGYGPVCAERFGLEWGEQRAAQNVTVNVAPGQQFTPEQVAELARNLGTSAEEDAISRRARMRRTIEEIRASREARNREAMRRDEANRAQRDAARDALPDDDEDRHFM